MKIEVRPGVTVEHKMIKLGGLRGDLSEFIDAELLRGYQRLHTPQRVATIIADFKEHMCQPLTIAR